MLTTTSSTKGRASPSPLRLLGAAGLLAVLLSAMAAWQGRPQDAGLTPAERPPGVPGPAGWTRGQGLPAALPLLRDGTVTEERGWTWGRGALLAVAGVALAGVVTLWRRNAGPLAAKGDSWRQWLVPQGTGSALRVTQSTRLSGRASVHVVTWRGSEWLLGLSEKGIELLARAPESDPGAPATAPAATRHDALPGARPAEEGR